MVSEGKSKEITHACDDDDLEMFRELSREDRRSVLRFIQERLDGGADCRARAISIRIRRYLRTSSSSVSDIT